jgi:hypothetical protein
MLFDMVPGAFQELSVMDAAGTSRFAGATTETKIDVTNGSIGEGHGVTLESAHQVNAPPGRIIFISGLEVGRAGRETKTAMNTGQGFLVIQKCRCR